MNLKKSAHIAACILSMLSISACATIFNGTRAKVWLSGNVKEPVDIIADNKHYENVVLPAKIKVKRGFKDSEVTVSSPNYESGRLTIGKKFNGTYIANILVPIGFAIDAATGAMMKPEQKNYYVDLVSKNYSGQQQVVIYNQINNQMNTPKAAQAPEEEERVTRDAPGQTDLEKTIIRWYVDSDPAGARVFWRVISSIPQEVKNTNESYLTTTPYEETRSFNIIGLTYANAHDVQIEIKVTKRGYEDQIKRFNVRQAIDQQEISTFFELVPVSE